MDKRLRTAGAKIRQLRKGLGLTQEELGRKVGLSQVRVSKLENGTEGSAELVGRVAGVLGVPMGTLWPQVDEAGSIDTRKIRIVGQIAAGAWKESVEFPLDEQETTTVQLPGDLANVPVVGMIVNGQSVNKVYPDRSVVFVASLHSIPGAPKPGSMVSVLRSSADGTHEMTLKQYHVDANGKIWLLPQSTEPEFQAPIEYLGPKTEEVVITGVVVAAMVFPKI